MLRRSALALCESNVDPAGAFGGRRFNETPAWTFWDPVWGGKWNAQFEEPYFTRTMMGSNYRVPKSHQGTAHIPHEKIAGRFDNGASCNPDMMWAARKTPASAVEVEAATVTCMGSGSSLNTYFTPRSNTTRYREMGYRHHMQWIFVPPDRAVACPYCHIMFKRKAGWAPSFDSNLRPTVGDIPVGGSLDPCLKGKRNGEAVEGAVKI
eukprot:TRINITY_DN42199_c0_g1_i1.p1 TRINITY_DN42199_c0_g1~~TRINITY_DN42199_c0_g1_i1.p1  ORF type:complete len:219 (+),score=20.03 TRINITY_DN42199_c0_g1_i1:35-658(+)